MSGRSATSSGMDILRALSGEIENPYDRELRDLSKMQLDYLREDDHRAAEAVRERIYYVYDQKRKLEDSEWVRKRAILRGLRNSSSWAL